MGRIDAITAAKPADPDKQVHHATLRRKIQKTQLITTVNLVGYHAAVMACRALGGWMSSDHDTAGLCGHRVDNQSAGDAA